MTGNSPIYPGAAEQNSTAGRDGAAAALPQFLSLPVCGVALMIATPQELRDYNRGLGFALCLVPLFGLPFLLSCLR